MDQGGRTITLRQIKPIVLPPPAPESIPAAPTTPDPEFQARLDEYQATNPSSSLLFLSATVYRNGDLPPRTLVQWWPAGGTENIHFWSSADFALIAGGIQSFVDSAGKSHSMMVAWGNVEIDRMTALQAARVPAIPEFPDGNATFAFVGKAPADKDLLVIQSLHGLYNKNHDQLLTAYQGREQARLTQQAELRAHPPQPKDITFNYWRIGGGTAAPTNGGAK